MTSSARGAGAFDVLVLDPIVLESEGDHTARITVGKNLSSRAFASYSTFLGGTQDQAAELRYQLTDKLEFRGGIDNLLDREPPIDYVNVGYDQSLVGRPGGRFWFMQLRKSL